MIHPKLSVCMYGGGQLPHLLLRLRRPCEANLYLDFTWMKQQRQLFGFLYLVVHNRPVYGQCAYLAPLFFVIEQVIWLRYHNVLTYPICAITESFVPFGKFPSIWPGAKKKIWFWKLFSTCVKKIEIEQTKISLAFLLN